MKRNRTAHLLGSTALAAGLLASPSANAHGVDANRASVRLAGDTAYVIMTPPAEAFPSCDRNDDQRLSVSEVRACRAELLSNMAKNFSLSNEDAEKGERFFADVSTPHTDGHAGGAHHVRFTLRYRWAAAPKSLTVRYGHGDVHPLSLQARRVTPSRFLSKQRPVGPAYRITLDAKQPAATFFEAKGESKPRPKPKAASAQDDLSHGHPHPHSDGTPVWGFMIVAAGVALMVSNRNHSSDEGDISS